MKQKQKTTPPKQTRRAAKPKVDEVQKLSTYWLRIFVPASAVILFGLIFWLSFSPAKQSFDLPFSESYLSNNNNAVCVAVETTIECEDLQSTTKQRFDLPAQYQRARDITASDDGAKLLIRTEGDDVVVTDNSFKEIRKVFTASELQDRTLSYEWVSGSSKLLISEIRRELGDAEFLPEPLVVTMLDIATGESRRVYKTGEKVDVEHVNVLGGDNEYAYITLETAKNWVAKSTDQPFETFHAIRLSDGAVQPINVNQVVEAANDMKVNAANSFYDSDRDAFIFTGTRINVAANATEGCIIVAKLETNSFGPHLKVVHTSISDPATSYKPVTTSTGTQLDVVSSDRTKQDFKFIDDNGSVIDLQLTGRSYDKLLSLRNIPDLPKAK